MGRNETEQEEEEYEEYEVEYEEEMGVEEEEEIEAKEETRGVTEAGVLEPEVKPSTITRQRVQSEDDTVASAADINNFNETCVCYVTDKNGEKRLILEVDCHDEWRPGEFRRRVEEFEAWRRRAEAENEELKAMLRGGAKARRLTVGPSLKGRFHENHGQKHRWPRHIRHRPTPTEGEEEPTPSTMMTSTLTDMRAVTNMPVEILREAVKDRVMEAVTDSGTDSWTNIGIDSVTNLSSAGVVVSDAATEMLSTTLPDAATGSSLVVGVWLWVLVAVMAVLAISGFFVWKKHQAHQAHQAQILDWNKTHDEEHMGMREENTNEESRNVMSSKGV